MKVYGYSVANEFINSKLVPLGYEVHNVPGSLVDGAICISPDNGKYHFVFQEKYLNAWSSGVVMRRCRKLPKWAVEFLEHEFDEEEEGVQS